MDYWRSPSVWMQTTNWLSVWSRGQPQIISKCLDEVTVRSHAAGYIRRFPVQSSFTSTTRYVNWIFRCYCENRVSVSRRGPNSHRRTLAQASRAIVGFVWIKKNVNGPKSVTVLKRINPPAGVPGFNEEIIFQVISKKCFFFTLLGHSILQVISKQLDEQRLVYAMHFGLPHWSN